MRKKASNLKTQRILLVVLVITLVSFIAWADETFVPGDPGETPNLVEWQSSDHANAAAEAFNHWNSAGEVSTSCAKCHSTPGHLDFLGADGTTAGVVDNPAPIGTTIQCVACHNDVTLTETSVTFPSGVEVTGLGDESRCMDCHQGRESGVSVAQDIADANVGDDTVSSDLGFVNIHYLASAATQFGNITMGGYQYSGKSYDSKNGHVHGMDTCIDCHDPHTLAVKTDKCSQCHGEVADQDEMKNVRFRGSLMDYDGDGNTTEGIYYEIQGLQEILYGAMQAYGTNQGAPLAYDASAYPYFFSDDNSNGQVDEGEGKYTAWTPRLVKASYNYQMSIKDPGAYAHGGKYIIELLYDSIEDLDPNLVQGLAREDAGHFDGAAAPFRHWDAEGEIPGSCSKCHSADGLPFMLKEGVSVSQPIGNGLMCSTCHDAMPEFTRRTVNSVAFPSGAVLSFGDGDDSNLCISCHQGRESGASVTAASEGYGDDEVITGQGFINVHYLAAGATMFGSQAGGAYEYPGKTYKGLNTHVKSFNRCIKCHDTHKGTVDATRCSGCHDGVQSVDLIRKDYRDFDGDGDIFEGIAGEVDTMRQKLLDAIVAYGASHGTPIQYTSGYPYFKTDTGASFKTFTPRLLKACYNYQFALKDPGNFAHNGKYIMQVLYDSCADLGAAGGMIRP